LNWVVSPPLSQVPDTRIFTYASCPGREVNVLRLVDVQTGTGYRDVVALRRDAAIGKDREPAKEKPAGANRRVFQGELRLLP
jgi:hypothetical protein